MQPNYILNRLPIGIVVLDHEFRVTSYSGAASALFGEQRLHQSLGLPIHATHPPQARGKIDWLLQQSKQDGASGYAAMLVNVPDKVLQLRMVHLRDAGGRDGYCLILYDLTDLTSGPEAPTAAGEPPVQRPLYKLPVSSQGRIALLDISEVATLRADGHYTDVCTGTQHYFCNLSLSQLESRLPPQRFLRVHRSHVINLAHAESVRRQDEQFVIVMAGKCGHEVPVGRSHIARLRELLGL